MKKGILLILGILVVGCGVAVAAQWSLHLNAFADFDLDEDGDISVLDLVNVVILDWYNNVSTTPPNVLKDDVNLNGVVDLDDVNISIDAWNYSLNYGLPPINYDIAESVRANEYDCSFYPGTEHAPCIPDRLLDINHYLTYTTDLDTIETWFWNYTMTGYRLYSSKDYPQTPYTYVCIDYATDNYWIFNKHFLEGDNELNSVTVLLPPMAIGRSYGHGFNWVLTSPNWRDPYSWVVFEPQLGEFFTFEEIISNETLAGLYLSKGINPDKPNMWVISAVWEYNLSGSPYTFEIFMNGTVDENNQAVVDTIKTTISITHWTVLYGEWWYNGDRPGVEMDHTQISLEEGPQGDSSTESITEDLTDISMWPDPRYLAPPLK